MASPVIILQLTRLDGRVQALTVKSPIGEPEGTFTPPYSGPHQREAVALALEAATFELPRWQQAPDKLQALKDLELGDEQGFKAELREQVGRTLYETLFPPDGMRRALHAVLNAGSDAEPARVELRLSANATDLGTYPWELLYDDTRGFLFAGRRAALVRYVACELPRPELVEADTLNLLLITARPIDPELPPLPDAESKAIEDGLAEPIRKGYVHVVPLPQASPTQSTWDLLNEHLITHKRELAPHVFHFDGHGGFGRRCPQCHRLNPANATECQALDCHRRLDGKAQGYLAFEGRNKHPHWISAQELSNLLAGAGVRLAVLTACKSAVVAGESVFAGMGPALIQAGVPAVVAMQFSITAGAAKQFAELLYLSLGQRDPLTLAMGQARAALFGAHPTAWYRPVLYLRTDEDNPEGRLFTVARRRTRVKGRRDAQRESRLSNIPTGPVSSKEPEWQATSVQEATPQPQVPTIVPVPLGLVDELDKHQKELDIAVRGYIESKGQAIRCERVVLYLDTGDWKNAHDYYLREVLRLQDNVRALPGCKSRLAKFNKTFEDAREQLQKAGPTLPKGQLKEKCGELRNYLEFMRTQADDIARKCEEVATTALKLIASDIQEIFKPPKAAPAETSSTRGVLADKARQEEIERRKVLQGPAGVPTAAPESKTLRAG